MPLIFLFLIPVAVMCGGLYTRAVGLWLTTVSYSFTDRGLEVVAPHLHGAFPWQDVAAAYESQRYLVLSGPGALQILPLRDLRDDDLRAIRTAILNGIGKRANLRLL